MVLVLLGPPGSGKGTQSEFLVNRFGYRHISVGEALREASKRDREIKEHLDEGRLVPLSTVEKIFKNFIKSAGDKILLDGVPRNIEQAKMVERIFSQLNKKIDYAIYLDIGEEKIMDRILNRWICKMNGSEMIMSGKEEELLKDCKGTLEKRSDDNVQTFKKRLETYRVETEPLIDFYKSKNILLDIKSDRSKEEVLEDIVEKAGL